MGLLQYRTIGQFLLFICAAIGLYQGLKRWRIKRAIAKLSGKVVLVTGASSGLGEGTCVKGCGLTCSCTIYSHRPCIAFCGDKGDISRAEPPETAAGEVHIRCRNSRQCKIHVHVHSFARLHPLFSLKKLYQVHIICIIVLCYMDLH